MGYGVLGCKGKQFKLISMGVIALEKYESHPLKLKKIFERCLGLIDSYHPDEMALEAPFFGKNVQSMLKLGRAQGVAMASALFRDIPIFEYAPKRIKQSITGNGNASKEQVALMLKSLLRFEEIPKNLDATDGMAAAVCHFFQGGSSESPSRKSYGSWKSFLSDNPDRIK
ncbi:MAG: crossover junction endodeoxyribonuclease RuvC [Flavobacteriales bacterium]|nr:crossover junction endodeoxyribonuclease RuvC [Bacteroidota bacterium]MCB9241336.1 crossover junction endodeoxyribonuclease RuvC [Flavobacteriales bacterium]